MTQATKMKDKPRIGITLGDLNGIGPEVVLKALADVRLLSLMVPVVYGSSKAVAFYKKLFHIEEFNYNQVKNKGQYSAKQINVVNAWENTIEINPGQPSPITGKAAWEAIKNACDDLKDGHLDAIVTAPIDKNTIQSEEFQFKGHTDFLASYFEAQASTTMCMVCDDLKIALATEHVALRDVPGLLTKELITSKVNTLTRFLQESFGIKKPKIAVLGLNPHAGEEGLMGREEEDIILPALQELKNNGKIVSGPFPADGFFGSYAFRKFDGVLAMYHDQGLIPLKFMAFEQGVNVTAGLPIVRTSPDHGTAYAIAGKNLADATSMRHAMYLACDILKLRPEPSTEKLS